MMVVISTQYMENYGTSTEPYWKYKGGYDYKILNVPADLSPYQVLEQVRDRIEYKSPQAEEYVLECTTQPNDWMSEFEKSQLEYDGKITYPEPVIHWEDIPFLKQIDEVEKVKELNNG
jgi:hypothetical protein